MEELPSWVEFELKTTNVSFRRVSFKAKAWIGGKAAEMSTMTPNFKAQLVRK